MNLAKFGSTADPAETALWDQVYDCPAEAHEENHTLAAVGRSLQQ